MPVQSEAALENGLIATLQQMNYEYVQIEEEKNTTDKISKVNLRNITGRDWKRLDVRSLLKSNLRKS